MKNNKTSLVIFGLMLIITLSGCGEPYGGGAGYQYLGSVDSIHRSHNENGRCISTTIKVDNDSFTVAGRVEFSRDNAIYVWVNLDKNTLRLRRQSVTSEHPILTWKILDWRLQNGKDAN